METIIVQIAKIVAYGTIIILALWCFETVAFGGSNLNPMMLLTSIVQAVADIPDLIIDFVTQLFIGIVDAIIGVVWELANISEIPQPSAGSLI